MKGDEILKDADVIIENNRIKSVGKRGNAPAEARILDVKGISFRKPGRYRVLAQTTRLRLSDHPSDPVPLQSNTIEIEVVAPEPGWAEARLHEAVASLDRGDLPPPAYGQIFTSVATRRSSSPLECLASRLIGLSPLRGDESFQAHTVHTHLTCHVGRPDRKPQKRCEWQQFPGLLEQIGRLTPQKFGPKRFQGAIM